MTISSLGPHPGVWSVSQQPRPTQGSGGTVNGTPPGPPPPNGDNAAGSKGVGGSSDPFHALASDLQALLTQFQSDRSATGTGDATTGPVAGSTTGNTGSSATSSSTGTTTGGAAASDPLKTLLADLQAVLGASPPGGSTTDTDADTDTAPTTTDATAGTPQAAPHHHHHARPADGTDGGWPPSDTTPASGSATASSATSSGTGGSGIGSAGTGVAGANTASAGMSAADGSAAGFKPDLQHLAGRLAQALHAYAASAAGASVGGVMA